MEAYLLGFAGPQRRVESLGLLTNPRFSRQVSNLKKLKIDPAGPINETHNLKKRADTNIAANKWISTCSNTLKLTSLNVRSLINHFKDIQRDFYLLNGDIIALSETWYPKNHFHAPELHGYHGHHVMSGKGKGVSLFIKETIQLLSPPHSVDLGYLQIIEAKLEQFTLILVYRSPSHSSQTTLVDNLLRLTSNSGPTIILGDFNIHPKENNDHYNDFITEMKTVGFTQIIDKSTHKDGNILDHVYVRDVGIAEWQFHHPYYTDHDAICIRANL